LETIGDSTAVLNKVGCQHMTKDLGRPRRLTREVAGPRSELPLEEWTRVDHHS
jgi:hypothetical protein